MPFDLSPFSLPVQDLPLLREMSNDESVTVRSAATAAIIEMDARTGIEAWLIDDGHRLLPGVLRDLDEFLYAPDWWKAQQAKLAESTTLLAD